MFITDVSGSVVVVNQSWCDLTGVDADTALGDGWVDGVHPDDRADVIGFWWRVAQRDTATCHEFRYGSAAAPTRVRADVAPVNVDGTVIAWIGTLTPLDEMSDREAGEGFLRAVLANSSDLVVVIDETATATYVSDAARRVLGRAPEGWVGRSVLELVHPDDAHAAVESLVSTVDGGAGVKDPVEVRVLHSDGAWREVEVVANNLLDDPEVNGVLINARDVTERIVSHRREHKARSRFEQAFRRSPIGMALTTLEGRFVRVNQAMCELLGHSPQSLLSTAILDATDPRDHKATVAAAVELLEGRSASFSLEKRFLTAQGTPLWTRSTVTLLTDDDGEPLHFLTQIENIEERRDLLEQLRRSALRDPLTGLANRAGFEEYLESLSPNLPVAVLALDLDRFKAVNDTAGHTVGDEVLKVVASRIRRSIRSQDLAARIGGDEFVVVTAHPRSDEEVLDMAERILECLYLPIDIDGSTHRVGASGGVTTGLAAEALRLLVRADRASYAAKRAGGNEVRSFTV